MSRRTNALRESHNVLLHQKRTELGETDSTLAFDTETSSESESDSVSVVSSRYTPAVEVTDSMSIASATSSVASTLLQEWYKTPSQLQERHRFIQSLALVVTATSAGVLIYDIRQNTLEQLKLASTHLCQMSVRHTTLYAIAQHANGKYILHRVELESREDTRLELKGTVNCMTVYNDAVLIGTSQGVTVVKSDNTHVDYAFCSGTPVALLGDTLLLYCGDSLILQNNKRVCASVLFSSSCGNGSVHVVWSTGGRLQVQGTVQLPVRGSTLLLRHRGKHNLLQCDDGGIACIALRRTPRVQLVGEKASHVFQAHIVHTFDWPELKKAKLIDIAETANVAVSFTPLQLSLLTPEETLALVTLPPPAHALTVTLQDEQLRRVEDVAGLTVNSLQTLRATAHNRSLQVTLNGIQVANLYHKKHFKSLQFERESEANENVETESTDSQSHVLQTVRLHLHATFTDGSGTVADGDESLKSDSGITPVTVDLLKMRTHVPDRA
ncbi:MAG: hypothetical protein MHM6MM_000475 [Cercozoa sp. M6MM]